MEHCPECGAELIEAEQVNTWRCMDCGREWDIEDLHPVYVGGAYGVYYTPRPLDPACGTGAFLAHLADPLISNPPYASR